jgi:hypothetical protein
LHCIANGGDEGITEASDATKRLGFELFTKIKLLDWLWLRGDITNTTAEFRGSGDAIPLTEDKSVYSQPYTVVDLITRFRLPYKFGPGYLEPFLMFQNLLNTEYKQAQFFFESRLRNEPDPVADIHFTPGAPLGVLGGIGFIF